MVNPENKIKQPWENQPCPMCRASKSAKRCPGHGGGSGSSNSAEGSSDLSRKDEDIKASGNMLFFGKNPPYTIYSLSNEVDSQALVLENTFSAEVILKLLLEGKLIIDSNDENNSITIKLNCNLDSLSIQQKIEINNFLNSIVDELHAFEAKHNIASQFKFETDPYGKILSFSITMPTKETHEAFMQQLFGKNGVLQNILNLTTLRNADGAENKRKSPLPTPYNTKLVPPGSK
jgi:hypothetical protein